MSTTTQSYKENFLSVQQQTKNVDSSRKHQTKKQVFGEIKNVIHNQGIVTPLKQDLKQVKNTSSKFLSPAVIQFKQQNKNEYKSSSNLKTQRRRPAYKNEFEDFYLDNFDFRGKCCLKNNKSDQQVWSEMNLYNDSFLENIFNTKELDKNEDVFLMEPNKEENEEDPTFFGDIKNEANFVYWPDKKEFQEEADIHLMLEKPRVFDFDF